MNNPDVIHRSHWKQKSLLIVAVTILSIIAVMAWPDRPLSSEEQRLVGSWRIQSEDSGKQTIEFLSDRLGTTIYGEGYVGEFDWRIQNGQLVLIPYQYRSQKNSIKNLYLHCVLMFNSFSSGTPYPTDDPLPCLVRWIDDDTLELTGAPGSIVPTGYAEILYREP